MTKDEAHKAWRRAEDDFERQRRRVNDALAEMRAATRAEAAALNARDAAFKAWSDAEVAEGREEAE
jgi:hypothetical protein